jgi:hypothetical protein
MEQPESNQRMEELLRAYAKKRRDDRAVSPELMLESRARLHEEVRRTLGSPKEPRQPWGLPLSWWLRFAVGGSAALTVVYLIVTRPEPGLPATGVRNGLEDSATTSVMRERAADQAAQPIQQFEAEASGALAQRKQANANKDQLSATVAEPSERHAAPPAWMGASDSGYIPPGQSGPPSVELAIQPEPSAAPAAPVVAPAVLAPQNAPASTSPGSAPIVLFAAPPPATDGTANLSAAASPSASATAVRWSAGESAAGSVSQSVKSLEVDKRALEQATVLNSFRMEWTGKQVRVVDADGSVYEGRMVDVEKARAAADKARGMGSNGFAFQVSGTNKALQEKVNFTGNLTNAANLNLMDRRGNLGVQNNDQPGEMMFQNNMRFLGLKSTNDVVNYRNNNGPLNNAAAAQNWWLNGQVKVGAGNTFDMEAAPAQP